MNKTPKKVIAISFLLVLWHANCSAASELGLDGIRNYVENAVEQLLGIYNTYDSYARRDINIIKEHVISASTKPTMWERMLNIPIQRTVDEVQQNIFSGIIDFVEKQSYRYAYERTHNVTIANKVAKNMSSSVANRIAQSGELQPGALGRFVGKALYEAVCEQCNRFDSLPPTTTFVQERIIKCTICWEKYLESNCVALSPCGHWVCKKCAHEYYLERQGNPRCPQCVQLIDLNDLRNKLYPPSAPPLDY